MSQFVLDVPGGLLDLFRETGHQLPVLFSHREKCFKLPEDDVEFLHIDRFGEIMIGASAHRLHGVLDIAVPREENHFRRFHGFGLLDALQQLPAA